MKNLFSLSYSYEEKIIIYVLSESVPKDLKSRELIH